MTPYLNRGGSSGYNPWPKLCGGEDRSRRALVGAGLEVEGKREECSEITGVDVYPMLL